MSNELNGWASWPQPGKGAMRTWREVKRREAEELRKHLARRGVQNPGAPLGQQP